MHRNSALVDDQHLTLMEANASWCDTCMYMYTCINGTGTYPFTLSNKRFLQKYIKNQEKHKSKRKDGAFCWD